ncbi:SIS domain-containing protein [Streptomyces sp. DSM 44917]|uniref:SIS domain-containing protein n=1 Tax=Streptomyces boetiae TaxID=3075541 RepID=A0ABU2LF61_9ACTN|nr:SIS domain-containing protein [Streptomyces sp. DSM 44917]MDT0310229.1 SIS domain-containing protein [Streptomyces sp. DSM 44917]
MIDETLLDAPEALLRADARGLLRAAAASGAHVRTAARAAEESPLARLAPEGRPGTLLLAGPGPAAPLAADLLSALVQDTVRIARLAPEGPSADPAALGWPLPRWAGPLDLLLLATADGTEPGLVLLLENAFRRGLSVATVAPEGSPLAEATARRRNLVLPHAPAPFHEPPAHPAAPGPAWALVTPLLLLGGRLGLFPAGAEDVEALAARLDAAAERCGPSTRTHDNPAKGLAAHLAADLPLLWSTGGVAWAAARHAATTLTALAGRPALAAALPTAPAEHAALLGGSLTPAGDPDDFFRDRVDEPVPLRARVVLLRDPGPEDAPPGAAPHPADLARDQALAQGAAVHELDAGGDGTPLVTAAGLLAQLDFTAVYLALATTP